MAQTIIKIHNPNNLPTIDYRKIQPLQGNLKDLNRENYDKLKNVLIEDGFKIPFFVWRNTENNRDYALDGHQRKRVLTGENMADENGSREVPYLIVEAANEHEARKLLLRITSQYGTMTQDGFDEFVGEMQAFDDFSFDVSLSNLHFDALPLIDSVEKSGDDEQEKEKEKAPSGPNFSIELRTKEDCIQAKQVLKDFAQRSGQDIEDAFINIIEAGSESMLQDLGL